MDRTPVVKPEKVRCPDCKGWGELVSYSVTGDWSGPIRTIVYPCCYCGTEGWVTEDRA